LNFKKKYIKKATKWRHQIM
jgi:hypothetical protein